MSNVVKRRGLECRLLTHTESLRGVRGWRYVGVLERVLRDTGESYLGLSKVVVVSSIVGDKKWLPR